MEKVGIVGLDIAKNSVPAHGAAEDGSAVLSKALSRRRVLELFGQIEPCTIALEACAAAHYWSRELSRLGHDVRLIAPQYVKTRWCTGGIVARPHVGAQTEDAGCRRIGKQNGADGMGDHAAWQRLQGTC